MEVKKLWLKYLKTKNLSGYERSTEVFVWGGAVNGNLIELGVRS